MSLTNELRVLLGSRGAFGQVNLVKTCENIINSSYIIFCDSDFSFIYVNFNQYFKYFQVQRKLKTEP